MILELDAALHFAGASDDDTLGATVDVALDELVDAALGEYCNEVGRVMFELDAAMRGAGASEEDYLGAAVDARLDALDAFGPKGRARPSARAPRRSGSRRSTEATPGARASSSASSGTESRASSLERRSLPRRIPQNASLAPPLCPCRRTKACGAGWSARAPACSPNERRVRTESPTPKLRTRTSRAWTRRVGRVCTARSTWRSRSTCRAGPCWTGRTTATRTAHRGPRI